MTLCCSINGHYDIVYPRSYPASAALCQCESPTDKWHDDGLVVVLPAQVCLCVQLSCMSYSTPRCLGWRRRSSVRPWRPSGLEVVAIETARQCAATWMLATIYLTNEETGKSDVINLRQEWTRWCCRKWIYWNSNLVHLSLTSELLNHFNVESAELVDCFSSHHLVSVVTCDLQSVRDVTT